MSRKKTAFGIFQDGLTVKIAELSLNAGLYRVEKLQKMALSKPLKTLSFDFIPEEPAQDISFSDFDGFSEDFDAIQPLDFELDTIPVKRAEKKSEKPTNKKAKGERSSFEEIRSIFNDFSLSSGLIGVSANDGNLTFHQLSFGPQSKIESRIKNEVLPEISGMEGIPAYDWFYNADGSFTVFVHHGEYTLFNALRAHFKAIRRKSFFSIIDINEVSLINLVRTYYDFKEDEYTLLLYIGSAYKVGIVLKGKEHYKTFNIAVNDTDPQKLRAAVYSKITLEQDTGSIPFTKNILLAGDYVGEEDLAYFNENALLEETFTKLELPTDLTVAENVEEDAESYVIPISLAYKCLHTKNNALLATNLLPKDIIESQKPFKLAWHGVLLFVLLFVTAYLYTVLFLKENHLIKDYNTKLSLIGEEAKIAKVIQTEFDEQKNYYESLLKMQEEISGIVGSKNQWSYILKSVPEFLQSHPLSWLGNVEANEKKITLIGYVTKASGVNGLAQLMPGAIINRFEYVPRDKNDIWRFTMDFSYFAYDDFQKIRENKYYLLPSEKEIAESGKIRETARRSKQRKAVVDEHGQGKISENNSGYLKLAKSKLEAGDYDQAIDLLNDLKKGYPDDGGIAEADYYLGLCYFKKNEFPKAEALFEETVARKNNFTPSAYLMLGETLSKSGNSSGARFFWEELTKIYPAAPEAKTAQSKLAQLGE